MFLLLSAFTVASKAAWTDVTVKYLQNPGFTNGKTGWIGTFTSGNQGGYWRGNDVNYGCMEVYNKEFDIYQVVSNLPAGHYRLSVQSFYRAGSWQDAWSNRQNNAEYLTTVIYADNSMQAVKSLYDWGSDTYVERSVSPDGKYYPDDMSASSTAFQQGGYMNVLEFDHAGGDAQIGIKNEYWLNANWCIFDNFKLEYDGTVDIVKVSNITLRASKTSIKVGETVGIRATVQPTNADLQTLTWTSSDPFVLTVGQDGHVIGRGAGTATVTATAQDGSGVSKTLNFTVTKDNTTDTRTWTDITSSYITNPDFNVDRSGWEGNAGNTRASCQECYNYRYIDFYQTLPSLPKGHYRLSVQGYQRNGDNAWNLYVNNDADVSATLFVRGDKNNYCYFYNDTTLSSYFSQSFEQTSTNNWISYDGGQHYFPNTMETAHEAFQQGAYKSQIEFDVNEDGLTVQLGIFMPSDAYVANNWCIFSHFRLETTSKVVVATGIELTLPKTELVVGEGMMATVNLAPSDVSQKSVRWTSSNEAVATVYDGWIKAVGAGATTITASTIDGSGLSASKDITVSVNTSGEWIDVTNIFIENAGYLNNTGDGWTRESSGKTDVNYNAMEAYESTFNIYQQLTGLPKGRYRLTMNGYYRNGFNVVDNSGRALDYMYDFWYTDTYMADQYSGAYVDYLNGNENLTAYLYAGSNQVALPSVYAYEASTSSNVFGYYISDIVEDPENPGYYRTEIIDSRLYPNSMWSGSVSFQNGKYQNVLEFEAEGNITIGVRNDNYVSGNWCLFGNWKLEYKGDVVKVTGLRFGSSKNELVVGETLQIPVTITPSNALQKTLKWTSSNDAAATVSQKGVVTAVAPGVTTITASTTDGSNISKTKQLTVVKGSVNDDSFVINEIMASNVDDFASPAYNYDGWIELYNKSNTAMPLAGLYISDDPANLTQWQLPANIGVLPANGFKVIWFDSNDLRADQAPFKLEVKGGAIYISDASGKVLTSETYPAAGERNSYARTTDGGSTWGLTSQPTLGTSNAASSFATEQLAAPLIDVDSRLFTGSFTATATIPAGTTLRYTLDGSVPTLSNGYTSTDGIFQISNTTNLRLRLFADGKLASRVTTRSYILDDYGYILPVVSVVANNDDLYSDEMGALVRGTNGKPGHGQSSPVNWNMNWQRPVNFSYIPVDGQTGFNQDVDLEMSGGWSRGNSLKSFKLRGNKELGGEKNLFYPFFVDKPYLRNRTVLVRNGGNDGCRFRDPAMQYVIQTSGLNIDVQSYQPVHEFINGRYMGVLNMREANNKDFVASNYGWDDDEIDQFKIEPDSGYLQKCGTRDAFNELVTLSYGATNNDTYQEICNNLLDVDAYANYMAVEFFTRNWDWPQNNVKGFRHRDNGKFRFVMFDLDNIFTSDYGDGKAGSRYRVPYESFFAKEWYTFDQLYPTSLGRVTDSIQYVTIFKNLMKNTTFRRKFADAVSIVGGSVYEPSRVEPIINMLANRVYPAMQIARGESPWSTANSIINNMNGRARGAMDDICYYSEFGFNSSQIKAVSLSSNVEGATLLVNDMKVPTGKFNGYLFAPARLKAVAPAGYVFQGWSKPTTSGVTLKDFSTQWSYYDQGELFDNWQSPTYAENGWQKGQAPIGYNNPNVTANTQVDYQTQKTVYYFRTSVNLAQAPSADTEIYLDYIIDDGLIIYVNGTEAGRYNMRADGSFATEYAHGNPDRGSLKLPINLFHQGNNTIAVEVRNESLRSSDILWDGSLRMVGTTANTNFFSTEAEIALPDEDNMQFTAVFRAMTDAERKAAHINPVRINEVSAANTVFMNDYFKKNDWVELYNTTDSEVDVEGMYLTDNIEKPEKYRITKASTGANTKIPAHGYLVVWCDKLETTSQALHASFKIAAEGGYLLLTAADKSWTDTLTFSAHDGNHTVGRYPDGAASVYMMDVPTIASSNMLTSYMVNDPQYDVQKEVSSRNVLIAAANGFRIRFAADQLIVKADEDGIAYVDLYTTDGRLLAHEAVRIQNGTGRLSVANLPQGFYVARATDQQSSRVSCKFMK